MCLGTGKHLCFSCYGAGTITIADPAVPAKPGDRIGDYIYSPNGRHGYVWVTEQQIRENEAYQRQLQQTVQGWQRGNTAAEAQRQKRDSQNQQYYQKTRRDIEDKQIERRSKSGI